MDLNIILIGKQLEILNNEDRVWDILIPKFIIKAIIRLFSRNLEREIICTTEQ